MQLDSTRRKRGNRISIKGSRTNIFSKELSKALHKAFEFRQEADYSILLELENSEVTEVINQAEIFVKQVKDYIVEFLF